MSTTFHDFYRSDVQALWLLWVGPLLYVAWRALRGWPAGGVLPSAAGFVDAYALVFAFETMLDPLATGPLLRVLGIAEGGGATAVMLLFVLLGDFRVYLLVFALLAIAAGRTWRTALPAAAAWTLLVPAIAWPANAALRAVVPGADPNSIWLVYEVVFVGVALWLRARVAPAGAPALRRFLRAALGYVAVYYALWATADVLIQLGGLDIGWLLRVVPNQLYYGFWVPFVAWKFFVGRPGLEAGGTPAATGPGVHLTT